MQDLIKVYFRLWRQITSHRQNQFILLSVLMIIVSFSEAISIGAVLPFLTVLTAPERLFDILALRPLFIFFHINEAKQLIFPITVFFVAIVILNNILRLFLMFLTSRLSFLTGADLNVKVYNITLHQPYSEHCNRNSSEIIDSISNKISNVINMINMALMLISSLAILIIILTLLIFINPNITASITLFFSVVYFFIIIYTRKKLFNNGVIIAKESVSVIKKLQEGLGGIRDILIGGTQAVFCQIYQESDIQLRRAQASSLFISGSPRYIIEIIAIILIASLSCFLALQNKISYIIPIFGVLAVAAQRLLPLLQQVYSAWSTMQSGYASLSESLLLLEKKLPVYHSSKKSYSLDFNKSIRMKKVGFRYSVNAPYIFKNINLTINKGDKIGFIGKTGSGKTTLLDLIMCLLSPSDGAIEVDGKVITDLNKRSWQNKISHVPQSIFLADTTVAENIAFGCFKHQIDIKRVKAAAIQSKIADDIESWPLKYQTIIGEAGVKLSGGQRQRIGIARALYKKSNIIVLDEATSALDYKTEKDVMTSVNSLSKDITILIIAHRVSTLQKCNKIIKIQSGKIKITNNLRKSKT